MCGLIESSAKWLKLVALGALGLGALAWAAFIADDIRRHGWGDYDLGVALFALVTLALPGLLGWVGRRRPGTAGGCLVPLALVGFLVAALGGGSDAETWFVLAVLSLIPLFAGILFLIAKGLDPSGGARGTPFSSKEGSRRDEVEDR